MLAAGLTVVICPLLSLMQNQLHVFRSMNVSARSLNKDTPAAEKTIIHNEMVRRHCSFTPEMRSLVRRVNSLSI